MKRIIIVHNPRSSKSFLVEREVIDEARKLKGYIVGKYEILATNVEDNAKKLAKILQDGDLVVSAGGDGTAVIATNGVILSKKDVKLAFLPYGNFNDVAKMFRVKNFKSAVKGESIEVWPIEILVNDKIWRRAIAYVSVGMMAESTRIFDNVKLRKGLQTGKIRLVRSGLGLFKWWLRHRNRKFLPQFSLNNHKVARDTTDYLAVNGKTAGGVLKFRGSYRMYGYFYSEVFSLRKFYKIIWFLMNGMRGKLAMNESEGDVLKFEKPAKVEIQAEGEYMTFEDIEQIEIRKSGTSIQVIRGR